MDSGSGSRGGARESVFLTSSQGVPMLLNLDHTWSGIDVNCWEMWIWKPWRVGGCPQSIGHSWSLIAKSPGRGNPVRREGAPATVMGSTLLAAPGAGEQVIRGVGGGWRKPGLWVSQRRKWLAVCTLQKSNRGWAFVHSELIVHFAFFKMIFFFFLLGKTIPKVHKANRLWYFPPREVSFHRVAIGGRFFLY